MRSGQKPVKKTVSQLNRKVADKTTDEISSYCAPARDLGQRAGFNLNCAGRLLVRLDELERKRR